MERATLHTRLRIRTHKVQDSLYCAVNNRTPTARSHASRIYRILYVVYILFNRAHTNTRTTARHEVQHPYDRQVPVLDHYTYILPHTNCNPGYSQPTPTQKLGFRAIHPFPVSQDKQTSSRRTLDNCYSASDDAFK